MHLGMHPLLTGAVLDAMKKTGPKFSILTLKHKEYLAPHYIRVTLTGDGVELFKDATVGTNNKIFLPAPGAGDNEIYFDQTKSIRRTYTHRGINIDRQEMVIEFVAHGDKGAASAWAVNARPGDKLGVAMKNVTAPLYPRADWYLLVADASGLPVVSTILETLPPEAEGVAYIEVLNREEEIQLTTASKVRVNWVHNPHPGATIPLAMAVRNLPLPEGSDLHDGSHFAYVAAEYSTVRDIRTFLRKEKGWRNEFLYAYSYWKYGKSEDSSVQERQEEKREP